MPAFGIGMLIYLVIQAVIAHFVYRAAVTRNRRWPLVLAGSVFLLSIVAVFLVNSILLVLLVQALAIALYYVGVSGANPAPSE